jgi:hypothetical protein
MISTSAIGFYQSKMKDECENRYMFDGVYVICSVMAINNVQWAIRDVG